MEAVHDDLLLPVTHAEGMTLLSALAELEQTLFTLLGREGRMDSLQYTRVQALQLRIRKALAEGQGRSLEDHFQAIPLRDRLAIHPADLTPAA